MKLETKVPSAGNFSTNEAPHLSPPRRADTPALDGDVFEQRHVTQVQVRILEPEGSSGALQAAKMLMDKGSAWNDHETRALLVQAGWVPKLVKAMELLPPADQEKARADLAKSAVQYFEQNNGLEADIGNDFLRENREMLWTLFAEKDQPLRNSGLLGSLSLPFPEGYEKKIRDALVTADCFQFFAEMDEASKI